MTGIEWVQQVAEARIQRQLEFADAIDAKAGVLFAYCGGVMIAAASLARPGTEPLMWVAIASALIGGVAAGVILWPQTYLDPPDAEKLEEHVRQASTRPREVVEALTDQQLEAVAHNEEIIKAKGLALKLVIIFSALATILLGVEVGQGRG